MIDLSKIPALELPSRNVKIKILGVEQEQEIHALSGDDAMKAWALTFADENGENTVKRIYIALTKGAGLRQEDATALVRLDWDAAVFLANEVFLLTSEFDKSKMAMAEQAEKNSGKADSTDSPR